MTARRRKLPARTLAEVHEAFPRLRQSLLGNADNCMLSTLMELEGHGYTNAAQARGVLFHRYAVKVLVTLRETGEVSMPTEEAMSILYEVCAQRDVPTRDLVVVPARERRLLRMAALRLVMKPDGTPREFNMARLIDVEGRLFAKVRCEEVIECVVCRGEDFARNGDQPPCTRCDGAGVITTGATYERTLTGQPDALLADPHEDPALSGAVVLDWKTTRRAPAAGPDDDHHDDADHVSYMGYFQQRMYGFLVMKTYPAVNRVRLREFYPLDGDGAVRYATVYRRDLEHIERELAVLAELVDRALMEGSASGAWQPSPGKHCSYCPAPQRCPLDPAVRTADQMAPAPGGIAHASEAARLAGQYVVAEAVRKKIHTALKAWVDEHGPVPVKSAKGRMEMRFNKGRFGMHVPETSDRGPEDKLLTHAFDEASARKREESMA